MQLVDNSIALSKLNACNISLDLDGVIRQDMFYVYTTQAKKHVHEMMVLLHQDYVVFARPKQDKGSETVVYEFTNSMEVNPLSLVSNLYRYCCHGFQVTKHE